MKYQFLYFFLLITLVSCGKTQTQQDSNSSSNDNYFPISVDDPVPVQADTFQVNVIYVNFTTEQRQKYEKAIEIVKKVVASAEFKSSILSHSYNGQTTFVDNRGMSNSSIYLNILDGNETLTPAKNNQLDVEVELYYQDNSTIGYTYANTRRIWLNTKYFTSFTPASVAGNLFHEWLHKLGYTHASSYSVDRDYSVPYSIGRMMSSLGKKYESEI